MIEARFDAVRAILHRNLECQVHESRQIGSGQTGDGKSERRHSACLRPVFGSLLERFASITASGSPSLFTDS